ncbi:MAG: hypothetical protein KAR06_04335 [Deltaproteobacteria bacterium]|nr:hypothetical protein [Deltaproteobacteria bacterium]
MARKVKYAPQCNNSPSKLSFLFKLKEDLKERFNAGEITRNQRVKLITKTIVPEIGRVIGQARAEKYWKPTRISNLTNNGDGTFTVNTPQTNPVMHEGSVMVFCHELEDIIRAEGLKGDTPEFEAVDRKRSNAVKGAETGNYWPTANMNEGLE